MKDERHVRQRRAEGKKWRPAAILLAGVLAFLSLPITGKAADTGSAPLIGALTVAPGNVEMVQDISTSNLQIDVYRIADAQKVAGYDTYEWINTAPFGTVNIPNSPDTTSDQWKATAQEAAAIILGAPQEGGTEWNPSSTAARVQETIGLYVSKKMAEGETSVRFDGLPAGMYLVLAHGTDINNYAVSVQDAESSGTSIATISNSHDYQYTFSPELITIPTKEGRNTAANSGAWDFDPPAITLKPTREERLGNLRITKVLENYETRTTTSTDDGTVNDVYDDVTFVFEVTGYPDKTNYDSQNPTVIYHDYVSIVFNRPGTKSVLLSDMPVGAYFKIHEEYSGKKYTKFPDQFETIKANDTVEVTFTNQYDNKTGGGGSVTNKFSYDNGWTLNRGDKDNSEEAGSVAVPTKPEDNN